MIDGLLIVGPPAPQFVAPPGEAGPLIAVPVTGPPGPHGPVGPPGPEGPSADDDGTSFVLLYENKKV